MFVLSCLNTNQLGLTSSITNLSPDFVDIYQKLSDSEELCLHLVG